MSIDAGSTAHNALSTPLDAPPLADLESVIERGMQTFTEVGIALLEIRDRRLYRETHATFEEYCRERWGWGRAQAQNYISAAIVVENVQPVEQSPPKNMRQAMALSSLDPDEQREVAAGIDFGTATAADVLRAAKTVKSERRQGHEDERRRQKLDAISSTHPLGGARFHLLVADVNEYSPEIVNGSVAAIITDPPHPEQYIPLYGTLTRLADRLLRPGGHLVVMCVQSHLRRVLDLLDDGPLEYRWTLCYPVPEPPKMDRSAGVRVTWKPVVWLTKGKGKIDLPHFSDTVTSDATGKRSHEWERSVSGISALVERFTIPGETVLDPFVGGGSTAVAAVSLGRLFVGSDIDKACVEQTARRLAEASSISPAELEQYRVAEQQETGDPAAIEDAQRPLHESGDVLGGDDQ